MNVVADASLPGLDAAFPAPFTLVKYQHPDQLPDLLNKTDILLCRSTLKVDHDLLIGSRLKFVATASSGTDHIDQVYLKAQAIQLIDAKGSNATSVADYVMACLAYLDTQQLIPGNKIGIIGMGHVGMEVSRRLAANFNLVTYDPLKAIQESPFQTAQLEALFQCNLICLHPELHDTAPYPSRNLINQEFLAQLAPDCIIINAARGGIVNEEALLNSHPSIIYCTDVYLNEPKIDERIIAKATLCTPHIAGHSIEAKYAAVALVSEKLHRLAGLPIPQYVQPTLKNGPKSVKSASWQQQVLSLYNPIEETRLLKQAQNKEAAFLSLRKNHQNRHDFALNLC
ncbi:MAG: 4-phosphoerythronate dehydrogenase [Legionellales bacterium]